MSRSEQDRERAPARTPAAKQNRSWRRTALGLREPIADGTPPVRDDERDSSAAGRDAPSPEETFAARLRYLFAATRQPDGRPWSANAVARASGGRLTAQAVYSLYRGATPNPKLETILALSEVLGVDPEYFVSPGALSRLQGTHSAQYGALETDPSIAFVSRRMGDMTPADKAIIVELVRRLTGSPGPLERAPEPAEGAGAAGPAGDGSGPLPQRPPMRQDLLE